MSNNEKPSSNFRASDEEGGYDFVIQNFSPYKDYFRSPDNSSRMSNADSHMQNTVNAAIASTVERLKTVKAEW